MINYTDASLNLLHKVFLFVQFDFFYVENCNLAYLTSFQDLNFGKLVVESIMQ